MGVVKAIGKHANWLIWLCFAVMNFALVVPFIINYTGNNLYLYTHFDKKDFIIASANGQSHLAWTDALDFTSTYEVGPDAFYSESSINITEQKGIPLANTPGGYSELNLSDACTLIVEPGGGIVLFGQKFFFEGWGNPASDYKFIEFPWIVLLIVANFLFLSVFAARFKVSSRACPVVENH